MELIRVATFRAQRGRNAVPRTIAANQQDVEIITGGRAWFEQDGHLLEAVRGTVLWHVAGQKTIYRNDFENPYECIFACFSWDGVVPSIPRFSRWKDPLACLAFADEILASFHGEHPDVVALADYAYHTLKWHAVRGAQETKEMVPPAVRLAQKAIDENFRQDLPVAGLAATAAVSVPHLHALFRSHLGQTPHQLLMSRRMAEARRLLVATRKPVKEVAFDVGYPDVVTFCKVFRARCGTSPSRYRELYIHRTEV